MLELSTDRSQAVVVPSVGGRLGALRVLDAAGAEHDLLVTGEPGDDPLLWGCYPMAPFAGRLRDATLRFAGRRHRFTANAAPHALHGTVFATPWELLDSGRTHAELAVDLGWPLGGRAHQHLQLLDDALVCTLTVVAADQAMPVTIGWHPWFVRPRADHLRFTAMYRRGDDGLPTGELVAPGPRPWDDCFTGLRGALELIYDSVVVTVASDADHWVVYDEPAHAICVEPQSGPPDAAHLGLATVLEPGEWLQRVLTISWRDRI